MPEQIVQQRSRGFICITAHPQGCARNVEQQIEAVKRNRPKSIAGPRNVLVIGVDGLDGDELRDISVPVMEQLMDSFL